MLLQPIFGLAQHAFVWDYYYFIVFLFFLLWAWGSKMQRIKL